MNSAQLAKMKCPNCESVGTIDIDDYEAQMYCTECCIVLAMNLGESDQTRYDGDERNVVLREKADADDTLVDDSGAGGGKRGGGGASAAMGSSSGKGMLGGGKKNDAVFDFIQCLQRRTNVPDTVSLGAVSLYSQFIEKLKAKTDKANIGGDGGQNAVAAAVFAVTAARKGKTVPLAELSKICKDLTEGAGSSSFVTSGKISASESQWSKNILIKRSDIARTLGIEQEIRTLDEQEFDNLSRQFHLALGWPLLSCGAAAAFAKTLNRELSTYNNNMTVSNVAAVAVGLYMTRASKKLSSLVVPPHNPALPPPPSTSETLQAICVVTGVEVTTMTSILKLLQSNKSAFDKMLGLAVAAIPSARVASNTIGEKRPREDESSELRPNSQNEVRIVRQQ